MKIFAVQWLQIATVEIILKRGTANLIINSKTSKNSNNANLPRITMGTAKISHPGQTIILIHMILLIMMFF